ncbi:MAG: lipid-A-disaccharide synthase [Vicinamibacterales bacterium]
MSARLLLSCGEASGDLYAGALTRELLALDPSLAIAGLGGPQFAGAGGRLVDDYRELSVTGLTEWIPKLPRLLAARRRLVAAAQSEPPDALVLIDFSGFNFRLAPAIRRLGVPVIYYISPQIWASRPGRLATIRNIADRVLVIFPFEEPIYVKGGIPVEFVGHPLIDLAKPAATREPFLRALGLTPSAATVAILPGSRPNEVSRILPDLMSAAHLIKRDVSAVQFVVARAPHLDDRLFDAVRSPHAAGTFALVEGDTDTVLASADIALTASGTATVQAALHDTPMVVVYRMAPLSYQLARRVVNLDTIGMVNLIAGEKIAPEFVQGAFTPQAVAREAISMLTDRGRAARIHEGLATVRARLGGPGASRRAAEAILRVIQERGGTSTTRTAGTPR